jgi:hypothetical protein
MAVCRRCGALTDSPAGRQHTPHTRQTERSANWLTAQSRLVLIDRARQMRSLAGPSLVE